MGKHDLLEIFWLLGTLILIVVALPFLGVVMVGCKLWLWTFDFPNRFKKFCRCIFHQQG